jgi:uncharacterized protein YdhG (YjbR/CyaY superfamily)
MKKWATVTEYLRAVPAKPRAALQNLRKTIKAAAPGAVEVISYQMPAFKYQGRVLVFYAAFKDHCSFFPASMAVIAAHKDELKGYARSKGTIRFAADKPLPATLVKKLVKARIRENEARWPARG